MADRFKFFTNEIEVLKENTINEFEFLNSAEMIARKTENKLLTKLKKWFRIEK